MSLLQPITRKDGWFIGEHKRFPFTVTDQNSHPRAARDITDWNVSFQVAMSYSGPALWAVQAEITEPADGLCTVVIPATLTAGMTGDTDYWYTLRRTDSDHEEELAYGTAHLRDVYVNY